MTETLEGDFAVEFKALDLLNSGYSVFRRGDKAVHSSHQSVSISDLGLQRASAGSYLYLLDDRLPSLIGQVEDQILGLVIYRPSENLRPVLQVDPSLIRRASREWREALRYYASHQHLDQTVSLGSCYLHRGTRREYIQVTSSPQRRYRSCPAKPREACCVKEQDSAHQ